MFLAAILAFKLAGSVGMALSRVNSLHADIVSFAKVPDRSAWDMSTSGMHLMGKLHQ